MVDKAISRTPPEWVRRQLRAEVGFGCPMQDCRNPYLEYHHFDPPWEFENHHDPSRMIALCATHHAKALAFDVDQCRALKNQSHNSEDVTGRFEWMRHEILAVIGGNFYYENQVAVAFENQAVVWFTRDHAGRFQLNLNMITQSNDQRIAIIDNDWIIRGNPSEVDSPPNGSYLNVKYGNGDGTSIRFREYKHASDLVHRYEAMELWIDQVTFPLLTTEITLTIGGSDVRIEPRRTLLGGLQLDNNFYARAPVGFEFWASD